MARIVMVGTINGNTLAADETDIDIGPDPCDNCPHKTEGCEDDCHTLNAWLEDVINAAMPS